MTSESTIQKVNYKTYLCFFKKRKVLANLELCWDVKNNITILYFHESLKVVLLDVTCMGRYTRPYTLLLCKLPVSLA